MFVFLDTLLFLLSPTLWLGILSFSPFFPFFVFFREQGWTFSPWVKVYGKLGFWFKAYRMVGHDICLGSASGSGIKGMSHIISMIHMQQWWFGNFMQNRLCMHLCGHSSIKFYGHVTLGIRIHFPYLSQPVFPKHVFLSIHAFIRAYFGRSKNFSQHSPFRCIHIFFSKTGYDQWIFPKKSWKLSLFKSMLVFS